MPDNLTYSLALPIFQKLVPDAMLLLVGTGSVVFRNPFLGTRRLISYDSSLHNIG